MQGVPSGQGTSGSDALLVNHLEVRDCIDVYGLSDRGLDGTSPSQYPYDGPPELTLHNMQQELRCPKIDACLSANGEQPLGSMDIDAECAGK